MERRTAGVVVGILALVCLAMVGSVVYPLDTATAHGQLPQDEQFTVGNASTYHATGAIVVDGEQSLSFEGIVADDGARYQRLVEDGVSRTQYQASPDGPVYTRLEIPDESTATQMRESIVGDDRRQLLRDTQTGGNTTFVVRTNDTDLADAIPGTASVFVRSLHVVGYDLKSQGTPGVSVYEPQNGWYEGTRPYRITASSGELSVKAGAKTVRSATVTWDQTVPAGSFVQYLTSTLTGDDPETHRVRYTFEEASQSVQRPSWVPDNGE